MSARVLNPVMLTEFYKISSPSMMRRNLPTNRKLNTIKKDLFGSPNPNETKRVFEDELEKHQDIACKKWGFDFRSGYPVVGHNSQYIWERVAFTDFIPEMYTLTRAAHIRELPLLEATDDDLLLDERAAKENELSSSNIDMNSYVTDSGDDSAGEEDETPAATAIFFKVPIDGEHHSRLMAAAATAAAAAAAVRSSLRKKRRQLKITEFMKERKRLVPTPKTVSPIKRMRVGNSTSSTSKSKKSPGKCNLFSPGGRYHRN